MAGCSWALGCMWVEEVKLRWEHKALVSLFRRCCNRIGSQRMPLLIFHDKKSGQHLSRRVCHEHTPRSYNVLACRSVRCERLALTSFGRLGLQCCSHRWVLRRTRGRQSRCGKTRVSTVFVSSLLTGQELLVQLLARRAVPSLTPSRHRLVFLISSRFVFSQLPSWP